MTVVLDALLGLGLFNLLVGLILAVPRLFHDRRKRGGWDEAARRLAASR